MPPLHHSLLMLYSSSGCPLVRNASLVSSLEVLFWVPSHELHLLDSGFFFSRLYLFSAVSCFIVCPTLYERPHFLSRVGVDR